MSFVTSVYVQLPYEMDNQTIVDSINRYLLANGESSHQLKRLEDYTGGSKHPQVIMLGGGFNYFPESAPSKLWDYLTSLPWDNPDNVVMITYREGDEVKVWRI